MKKKTRGESIVDIYPILGDEPDISICSVLPREVENAIRHVLDDDLFVERVWRLLAGYYDLRHMELRQVSVEDSRKKLEQIQKAIANLKATTSLHSDLYPVPPELLRDLAKMETHYNNHTALLDALSGRATRNKSLRWLAGGLQSVFANFNASPRKLVGLIEKTLPFFSPGTTPSGSSIRNAIAESASKP
jgi:hypothetical protein